MICFNATSLATRDQLGRQFPPSTNSKYLDMPFAGSEYKLSTGINSTLGSKSNGKLTKIICILKYLPETAEVTRNDRHL